MVERKQKIQSDNSLPITHKCNLLNISCSTLYYKPGDKEVDLEALKIKKLMDKLHLNYPYMVSQFTSEEFTGLLKSKDIKISMDGKGRWIDNVFIERLWRSLKYEEVYLNSNQVKN